MISFDSSEINNWSDKPDSHQQLPELIRRLILATSPMLSFLNMPSGSSVRLPGWDGLLVVEHGNAWVPNGASAWEFSCEKTSKKKATADYRKRTADPKGVDIPASTFVFVTPRRWVSKGEWAKDRCEEDQWADVRALDADDLVAWLQQAPAVAHWFARLIGKLPDTGVVPLDQWWENWSSMTQPRILPELVLAGRQDQVKKIDQWFQGEPSYYYVQGDPRAESIAFLWACAHAADAQWGSELLARAVVVQTADAWRSLEGHSSSLVLVRGFSDGNVASQIAVNKGHYVLTPLDKSDDPRGDGCRLPRLGRDETVQALTAMGLGEARARLLARSTARCLPVMLRQLIDEAGGAPPPWASLSLSHSIVALILVGQWEGDHAGDKAIVAEVVGQPYETVERDVTDLSLVADSPLTKVGHRWRFISHEEVWHILAPRLTSSDIERFEKIAGEVFGAASPEFELPIKERYMANVVGKVLPHSDTLREGIARSLALMGTSSDRVKNVEGASYVPTRVVSSMLEGGKGWQIWATLANDLAVLAEAAPGALLDAVERDLNAGSSPFGSLFAQEGNILFEGIPHIGVLWALETLAWSQDHFSRGAKILARLAEIDPGGQVSNRPAESLRSLFFPRIRFSEASDEHRLRTLKMLLDTVPGVGWRLLVGVYPSSHSCLLRFPPSWRPWAQDGTPKPTDTEYDAFISEMEQLLLSNVKTNAERWTDLVGIIPRLSPEARQRAIELLLQQTGTLRQHPTLSNLWRKLREHLNRHNSYPDATGAMDPGEIEALECVYQELTPSDPVVAHAWLFDRWPALPEGTPQDPTKAVERISEAQRTVVQVAYKSGGTSAILDIAGTAENPIQVGRSLALGMEPGLALDLALAQLGSGVPKLRDMARGIFAGFFSQSGWKMLEEAIGRVRVEAGDSRSQALADIYRAAPALRGTWQRLHNESQEVQTAYWELIGWPSTKEWDAEDLAFAVRQLLSVRRSADAVRWLAYEPMSHEVIIQLLEALPADMTMAADSRLHADGCKIALLFEKLDQAEDVPDDVIARLEIPYIGILEHHRPDLAFHREVSREPLLFADLITWAFKRSDRQAEEIVDKQTRKHHAMFAYSALGQLRTLPGLKEDGSVDAERLMTWVSEARRLCKENDREDIGDQQIGQILANASVGKDGIWPCEPVRDLLDALASYHIGIGFIIGKSNLRGVTWKGAFDGGEQEWALADKYGEDAAKIAVTWPFTAQWLRKLSATYKADAKQEDQEADWSDQFEA